MFLSRKQVLKIGEYDTVPCNELASDTGNKIVVNPLIYSGINYMQRVYIFIYFKIFLIKY